MIIAICDDNFQYVEFLRIRVGEILKNQFCEFYKYSDPSQLINDVRTKAVIFDGALLDICIGEVNGIDVAKELNEKNPACFIIYVTGFMDFVLDVYETNHCYYVLKTQIEESLPKAFDKILKERQSGVSKYLMVKSGKTYINISKSDIVYVERNLRTTSINMKNNEVYPTTDKISVLEEKLPENMFSRCHESYIVNCERIKYISRSIILMENGIEIPISRKYTGIFKKILLDE